MPRTNRIRVGTADTSAGSRSPTAIRVHPSGRRDRMDDAFVDDPDGQAGVDDAFEALTGDGVEPWAVEQYGPDQDDDLDD